MVLRAAALLALGGLVAVGCSSSAADDDVSAAVAEQLRESQLEQLGRLNEFEACIASEGWLGLDPFGGDGDSVGGAPTADASSSAIGLVPGQGYGLAPVLEETEAGEELTPSSTVTTMTETTLTAAELEAQQAAIERCRAAAGLDNPLDALGALGTAREAALAGAYEDDRFLQAEDRWGACMRREGFDVGTLGEPALAASIGLESLIARNGLNVAAALTESVELDTDSADRAEALSQGYYVANTLGELAELERRMASTDTSCREEAELEAVGSATAAGTSELACFGEPGGTFTRLSPTDQS